MRGQGRAPWPPRRVGGSGGTRLPGNAGRVVGQVERWEASPIGVKYILHVNKVQYKENRQSFMEGCINEISTF